MGQFEFRYFREIWTVRRRGKKNCSAEMKVKSAGDVWTWTALDAETKLIPCWFVGQRDASCAYHSYAT